MTGKEKARVTEMTLSGHSVSEIAEELGVSKNTIKSFLRRNKNEMVCLNCGAVITQQPHKKMKKFCSDQCRMKWWNAHPSDMIRKSAVKLQCQCCGKEFQDYSVKQRKYCSRSCYIKMRYGGADNA